MNASDLSRLLGEPALGSKILNGNRELSKAHIRTLADRFKVRADLFLRFSAGKTRPSHSQPRRPVIS
jgi:antitoxin component HigA of HigAB toxin-antitoxin module